MNNSKLYQIASTGSAPIILAGFMIPIIIAIIQLSIDAFFNTSFSVSYSEKWVFNFLIPAILMIIILLFILQYITKYLYNLFRKQSRDLDKIFATRQDIPTIEKKMIQLGGTIRKILLLRKFFSCILIRDSFHAMNAYIESQKV